MSQFLQGKRILVVEDEMLVGLHLKDLLEEFGATALGPVGQVALAMEVVEKEQLDGAILDVRLGRDVSTTVADALVSKHVPFIFSSGYGEPDLPERFKGIPKISKPMTRASFVSVLWQVFPAKSE
jgi:CheY-like chemotaxis protein